MRIKYISGLEHKGIREYLGLTLRQMAEYYGLKTYVTVYLWEKDKITMPKKYYNMLQRLLTSFNASEERMLALYANKSQINLNEFNLNEKDLITATLQLKMVLNVYTKLKAQNHSISIVQE